MNNKIDVNTLASFLGTSYIGSNYSIKHASSICNIKNNCISFTSTTSLKNENNRDFLILAPLDFITSEGSNFSVIKVTNPKLSFAKVLKEYFTEKPSCSIHSSTTIGTNTSIHKTVTIGNNSHIGNDVSIGENTIINHNVIIHHNTQIGADCYIKSGAIIGEEGFGFENDTTGTPIRIPHIGNVIIKNNVEIGANTVISRGTLDSTFIDSHVKIDDLVFIAHNCSIGEKTLVIAGAEISGSVSIGKNCWIAPHATIIQKIKIGDNTIIGIGSLILKDVASNKKVMGLEAIDLKRLIKLKKRINYGE